MSSTSPSKRTSGVIAGVVWTVAGGQGERVLGVLSIAILARLLTPSDFGIVAMAGTAVAMIEVFGAFGFDWALVRMHAPAREHYDTAWSLRIAIGFLFALCIAIIAFPAATFYGVPAVAPVLFGMAFNSLLGGFENIGTVDFRRNMDFRREFLLRISSKGLGVIVAVSSAYTYRSYWALIAGVTAARATTVIGSYLMSSFRPKLNFSRRRDLLSFSGWLLVGNLADTARTKFSEILVGRQFGPKVIGLYTMASELAWLPTTEVAAPINRVMFTRYSQYGGDVGLLREGFLQVSGVIWAIGLPAAVGLASCPEEIIELLLGKQWVASAPLLRILAANGAALVMAANTHYVYWALGRPRLVTVQSLVALALFVPSALVAARLYGVYGVALAQFATAVVVLLLNYATLMRTIRLRFGTILQRNWRVVAASVVMGFAVTTASRWSSQSLEAPLAIRVAALVLFGACVYVVVLIAIWLAAGCPSGPEREMLQRARALLRRRDRPRFDSTGP